MPVDVLWFNHERMTFACCAMLNEMLDAHGVAHHTREWQPEEGQGCIVVFHGGNLQPWDHYAAYLKMRFASLPWVLYISVGDESCKFPYATLARPRMKLWVQTPKPGRVHADRYFIEGTPSDCREWLDKAPPLPRDYDWVFAGQVNHARRFQLIECLRNYNNGPHFLIETKSFGAGVGHDLYYSLLKQAKVVPCPAGPATPDSFRFAEALEAGAVPVLDAYALDQIEGYWDMTLGNHPFIVLRDWTEFPRAVDRILENLESWQRMCRYWWTKHKVHFSCSLEKDLLALGAL